MATMIIRHSVQDYKAWKSVFDSKRELRQRSGERSTQILRQNGDGSNLIVVNEWDSLKNAKEFAASPELAEAMKSAGVAGPSEILFLEEAFRG